jgi:tRNA nucleotidyltransferase (CCA-adding enzyme)
MIERREPSHADSGLTIITTHINADFDALASMLAAQKLYPDALIVFPGSQEKNLRNFFIQSMVYLFNLADIKDIDFKRVKRLVIVDTRQASRIGPLSALLERPGIEIHSYDHHPIKPDDIRGQLEIHALTGATVTILSEIIRKQKIPLTSEEATIMCLGIYEDTGSFTFSSTTQRDFRAAAFLLSKGANLNLISSMISREISPEQVSYLNDMIQAANEHLINGIPVVVTTLTLESYLPDFAFLVHKMVKMENINAIFALALMENKIYLTARSRTSEVDVGTIVSKLGGGGHPSAAAATIKGKTLAQTEQELFKVLYKEIRPRRSARHLMSAPPIMIQANALCRKARTLFNRYNINALLVTHSDNRLAALAGYITRQVVEKAIYHKLGKLPVREYMSTELAMVSMDADLSEIQEKIIENKQRVLPVVDNDRVVGVITRTDLLNILVQQSNEKMVDNAQDPVKEPLQARTRMIANFMRERLSKRIIDLLRTFGEIAAELNYSAFAVGGFVRDLFLYRTNEDVDIVVEGDGIAFAKTYARRFNVRIHTYRKFGTAVVIFNDGFKVDVASARMEHYKFPAALPDVEMSSIKLDLYRRDFTINTLAVQLNPRKFGRLIDFFSAQKDIKDHAIRVLHNLSFVEDPTRVFRAIRFEQRFGFRIGKLTSSLIENAVKMDFFKRLSGRRVLSELRLILEEDNPVPALRRLQDYNLLKVIHPSIKMDVGLVEKLNAVKKVVAWHDLLFVGEPYMKWSIYFMALMGHGDRKTTEEICYRLELPPKLLSLFCQRRFESERCLSALEQSGAATNSELYRQLAGLKIELILYMMASTPSERTKKAISYYYTHLRQVTIAISGHDLKALGLNPGPSFRKTLDTILDAKLNGQVQTRREQLRLAKQLTGENLQDHRRTIKVLD